MITKKISIMLIHIDWIIKAPTLPTDIKIQLLSITFILLSCDSN